MLKALLACVLSVSVAFVANQAVAQAASVEAQPGVPPLPKWTLVPRTAKSVPLGTVVIGDTPSLQGAPKENAVPLAKYGYVEEEYFISGTANVYAAENSKSPLNVYGFGEGRTVAKPNLPYTTRILVRRPADPAKFSGTVQIEPIRDVTEWTTTWLAAWPYMVANGDVYVGFSVSKDNIDKLLKKFDKARYAPLDIPDEGLRWDIMAEVAWLVRSPDGPLAKLGFLDQANKLKGVFQVYSTGWSLTGCMQAEFINKGHHARARRPDGRPLISGYIVGICPLGSAIAVPKDAPVIQVMSESEYSPQRADATFQARQPDSNKTGENRFRWYDIAGTSHAGYLDTPQATISFYQLGPPAQVSCAQPISALPGKADFIRADLANLDVWVRTGYPPPAGMVFDLNDDHTIKRDAYGNAVGGVRPFWVTVPTSTFVAVTDERSVPKPSPGGMCGMLGHEQPFAQEQLAKLYKDHDDYVEKVAEDLDSLKAARYLLYADAKTELDLTTKIKLGAVTAHR